MEENFGRENYKNVFGKIKLANTIRISRNIGEHYIWQFAQKTLLAGF